MGAVSQSLISTAYENNEDGQNAFLKRNEVNSGAGGPGNGTDSLFIIKTGWYPESHPNTCLHRERLY